MKSALTRNSQAALRTLFHDASFIFWSECPFIYIMFIECARLGLHGGGTRLFIVEGPIRVLEYIKDTMNIY